MKPCHVVVFGASGDLAKRKIYPALHALFSRGSIPLNTKVIGYGRTWFDDDGDFMSHATSMITARPLNEDFTKNCSYISGSYNDLSPLCAVLPRDHSGDRLFYLSVPPSVYADVVKELPVLFSTSGWNRVVIEKPFGRDACTFMELKAHVQSYLPIDSIYLMDHYLGKSAIDHIRRTPFLTDSRTIKCVDIIFEEAVDAAGRSYFDQYGIVRDVVHNHVLQIAAVILNPVNKLAALRNLSTLRRNDTVLGQYRPYPFPNSMCATSIDTVTRYRGVIPVRIRAAKGMKTKCVQVRINDGAYVLDVDAGVLHDGESTVTIPSQDAYETVIADVFQGTRYHFVDFDEIQESWRIVADVLDSTDLVTYPLGDACI